MNLKVISSGSDGNCYILTNFDTSIADDIYRIQLCRELDFNPYPMIYDKEHANPIYRKLQRWCNSVIFWKVPTFEDYLKYECGGAEMLSNFIERGK